MGSRLGIGEILDRRSSEQLGRGVERDLDGAIASRVVCVAATGPARTSVVA